MAILLVMTTVAFRLFDYLTDFFAEYCLNKANATSDQHKRYIWHFLKANFEQNTRAELLNLLGYRIEDVNEKLRQHIGDGQRNSIDAEADQSRIDSFDFGDLSQAVKESQPATKYKIQTGEGTYYSNS